MGSLTPWLIIGAIALAGFAGWQGHRMGYSAAEDDHRAELLGQIEAGQKLEAARRQALQQRDEKARQVQELIDAEPIVVNRCLSPSRGVQLNAPGIGR